MLDFSARSEHLKVRSQLGESSWTAHVCAKTDAFVTQTRFILTYADGTDKKLFLRRCVLKENFNLKKSKEKLNSA